MGTCVTEAGIRSPQHQQNIAETCSLKASRVAHRATGIAGLVYWTAEQGADCIRSDLTLTRTDLRIAPSPFSIGKQSTRGSRSSSVRQQAKPIESAGSTWHSVGSTKYMLNGASCPGACALHPKWSTHRSACYRARWPLKARSSGLAVNQTPFVCLSWAVRPSNARKNYTKQKAGDAKQCSIHCLAATDTNQHEQQQCIFRSATSTEDLQQAAKVRADAYYEVISSLMYSFWLKRTELHQLAGNVKLHASKALLMQEQPHARYVDSFKRQFVDQYVRQLQQQTVKQLGHALPECVCLVALYPQSQQVLATCDVRPPDKAAGQHPAGVPREDMTAAYVTNVAVDSQSRGQGLGFQLLEAAAALALEEWQAQALYTTVDPDNKVTQPGTHVHACDLLACPLNVTGCNSML